MGAGERREDGRWGGEGRGGEERVKEGSVGGVLSRTAFWSRI